MADDELFGPDGTQPPPAPPFLSDPLAGLVTGALFADTTAGPEFEVAGPYLSTTAATSPARRPRARATPARATQGRSLQAATSPDAIPVAAPLSARSATQHAVRPNPTAPARITPIRPAPPRVAPATWQPPRSARPGTRPAPAPASARRTRRRAGAGCSFFLVLIVIVIVAFVVLGIVLGKGTGGFGLGGG